MKAPYRWLTEHVDTRLTPALLGERLQATSSVLEGLEDWSSRLSGLIVGRITSCTKHPDSDHLHVTQVETGAGSRQIVCGAPNVRSDINVIVALPGTKAGTQLIAETVIRGIASSGMLCSYEELGLPSGSDGIAILDGDLHPGDLVARVLGLNDSVLDLEITPNRPDLLGIYGLAREVASFEHRTLRLPELAPPITGASVNVQPAVCLRYAGMRLSGLSVGPSPQSWQSRLQLAGIRPINNLVDVSNYVMLELGQPIHIFDWQRLGGTPGVRLAKAGETLACLDGQTRTLTHQDIIVADNAHKPAALAGIMGGTATAVHAGTTDIFIESAVFPGAAIRRSSRQHRVRTEASTRMEKGLDPATVDLALRRACYLLQSEYGAHLEEIVDSGCDPQIAAPIRVEYAMIHGLLGVMISPAECKRILLSLGFKVTKVTKSSLTATPPSWRQDVRLPEDIVEELIRILGYDRVPATLPGGAPLAPRPCVSFDRKRAIRHLLAACGLNETLSMSFTSEALLTRCKQLPESAIRVQLPLSKESEFLIPEHIIPFLQNVSGVNRPHEELRIFEIGSVFMNPLKEEVRLSFLLRSNGPLEPMYAEAKGLLSHIREELGLSQIEIVPSEEEPTYLVRALRLQTDRKDIGWLGAVNPEIAGAFKIRSGRSLLYASLDLSPWLAQTSSVRRYRTPSSFPSLLRDLTFSVSESLPIGPLLERLAQAQKLQAVPPILVGTYRGDPVEDGRKSVTVRFQYGSTERTLIDTEVAADLGRIGGLLIHDFDATIS